MIIGPNQLFAFLCGKFFISGSKNSKKSSIQQYVVKVVEKVCYIYHRIPNKSPRLIEIFKYIFGLIFGGLHFGGAYIRGAFCA